MNENESGEYISYLCKKENNTRDPLQLRYRASHYEKKTVVGIPIAVRHLYDDESAPRSRYTNSLYAIVIASHPTLPRVQPEAMLRSKPSVAIGSGPRCTTACACAISPWLRNRQMGLYTLSILCKPARWALGRLRRLTNRLRMPWASVRHTQPGEKYDS